MLGSSTTPGAISRRRIKAIVLCAFAGVFPACGLGEPALGSSAYFQDILGVVFESDEPLYRCRRASGLDFSLVAAFQLPDEAIGQLRRHPQLLRDRPAPRPHDDHTLIQWSEGPLPSTEAWDAARTAMGAISYVEGGDCVGPYNADRVRAELPQPGAPDTISSIRYQTFGSQAFEVDALLLLNMSSGRLYVLVWE
jgi:hypothetical protein